MEETIRQRHPLPWIRFTILACLVTAIDSILCVSLWLAGGDSKYLESSVKNFSLVTSTFDLACLAAIRGVVLIGLFFFLEHVVLKEISRSVAGNGNRGKTANRVLLHAMILLTAFICLCYAVLKGGLVIHGWAKARQMHSTYKAVCIVAIVFPLLELLIGLVACYFMSKLRTQMVMLIVGEANDEEGWKKWSRYAWIRWLRLAQPDIWIMFAGIVFLLISAGVTSVAPHFLGKAIDYAICHANNSSDMPEKPCGVGMIDQTLLYWTGILVAGTVASIFKSWLFTLAELRYVSRFKKWVFATIMEQDVKFIDKTGTEELVNRLTTGAQVIHSAFIVNFPMLIVVVLQLCLVITLMGVQNLEMATILILTAKFIVAVVFSVALRIIKLLDRKYQQKLALISNTAEESINKIRTVRSFSNEVKMISLFGRYIDQSYSFGKKNAVVMGVYYGMLFFLILGAATFLFYAGARMIRSSTMSAGVFTSFLLYAVILVILYWYIYTIFVGFRKFGGISVELIKILDHRSTIITGNHHLDNALTGEIKFDNVTFMHPLKRNTFLLQDISFVVHPREQVALVGPCKASKTAIFDLIENFHDVQLGHIFLDGHDIAELDPVWFRRHIGVISQEPVLLTHSISDNISFGNENATRFEIVEAAKQANAHEFISRLEKGYDTMMNDVSLSRSQKQRVAIARALLPNPAILLIDEEATHLLDAETGYLVERAIDQAMRGRTVLVIAYRVSTIKNASQVLVVNNGRIAERGSRDELLAAVETHCS